MRVLWFAEWQPLAVQRRLSRTRDAGPEGWVERLAEELRRDPGVTLAVATPTACPFAPFEDDGVLYLGVPTAAPAARVARIAHAWRHHLTPPHVLAAGAQLARDFGPDMIHVHGTEGAFGLLAGRVGGTPVVISLQGILREYERQYFAGRSAAEVARLAAGTEFLKGRGALHRYLLLRRQAAREACIMRGARWFIGRTDWDRGVLAAANPRATYFHCDEIMRVPFYAARWEPGGPGGSRICTTSSALMGKGTECLLEALALLQGRGVPGLRLRVAGVHPGSELDGIYRRAAARLGVADRVDWLGRLDAGGIVAELLAADAFAYPSYVDNSPNSLAEAMLVGVPTVASRVGGIPTLLKDGDEGLLFTPGDAGALAAALGRLLDDRAAAARLGAAARVTATARHDPRTVAAHTLAIYEEIVARSRGARPAARGAA